MSLHKNKLILKDEMSHLKMFLFKSEVPTFNKGKSFQFMTMDYLFIFEATMQENVAILTLF